MREKRAGQDTRTELTPLQHPRIMLSTTHYNHSSSSLVIVAWPLDDVIPLKFVSLLRSMDQLTCIVISSSKLYSLEVQCKCQQTTYAALHLVIECTPTVYVTMDR